MFKEIISLKNLTQAYQVLEEKYLSSGRFHSMKGIDGVSLSEFRRNLNNNLQLIHKELSSGQHKFLPLISQKIPKKHGKGYRTIYLSSIRDRIIYQALFQIIQPLSEKTFSDNLYSYRSTHTHYHAIKNARRLILKNSEDYYVLKIDFKDYADTLDHKILLKKFKELGCDDKTLQLIKQNLKQDIFTETEKIQPKKGIVQGVALCSIAYNIYLNDVDHAMSAKPGLIYQRMGDDIIVFSQDKKALETSYRWLLKTAKARKLTINEDKTVFQKITEPFEYLGLEMGNGQIRLTPKNVQKMERWFKRKLNKNKKKKFTPARLTLYLSAGNFPQSLNWLRYYHLVTDSQQLQELDRFVRQRICIAITGKANQKAHRKLQQEFKINSCYTSFVNLFHRITHGRQSLQQLGQQHRIR